MIPLKEAQRRVLEGCSLNQPALVEIRGTLGCVVATPVISSEQVPAFDNTSMDGFAVRAEDTEGAPVRLKIIGELPAGKIPNQAVGPGQAIRIMTGAPIPTGATAVVMVEETEADETEVTIKTAVGDGNFVRRAGGDIAQGEVVIDAGVELRAPHLGVLASIGVSSVKVYPRLRVGVLSTGDELVVDGSTLLPGQIRESNKELLIVLLAQANCDPIDLGIARDDEESISSAIDHGLETCDALITSGGVSMGEYDLVKVVLDKLGDMSWMQIAIQPAKPFAFGLVQSDHGTVPVFGLPGNPVSSMVSFELLARPALRKMMGHIDLERPTVLAIADDGLKRHAGDGKTQFQRVVASFGGDGRMHVRSTGGQGSHQLSNSASANGLASLPDGPGVGSGDDVMVLFLD